MEILFAGLIVVFVLGTISVTGALRAIRIAMERTAEATEALMELERARSESSS